MGLQSPCEHQFTWATRRYQLTRLSSNSRWPVCCENAAMEMNVLYPSYIEGTKRHHLEHRSAGCEDMHEKSATVQSFPPLIDT